METDDMSLQEIKELVSSAFRAGRMDAQFTMGKQKERVRRKDAEAYITTFGYNKCLLDKWVGEKLITEYVGECKNSPRLYSLKEINELLLAIQIKKIV